MSHEEEEMDKLVKKQMEFYMLNPKAAIEDAELLGLTDQEIEALKIGLKEGQIND